MSKKLLALYSLKYNPFSPDVPASDLYVSAPVDSFCWRVEQQVGEGGYALLTGESGTGKSAILRTLRERLGALREVSVGVLSRPQASVADFYRELGDLFGAPLSPSNRWGGTKALREKWQAHIDASLYRPVLLIDEAQEMRPSALNELRLLASAELDARSLLTVIFAGDGRLAAKLQSPDLIPLANRIRVRLRLESAAPADLRKALDHLLKNAGNPRLIPSGLAATLCDHATGNYRVLMNMANDLLAAALRRELDQIDEKLFFDVFDLEAAKSTGKGRKP